MQAQKKAVLVVQADVFLFSIAALCSKLAAKNPIVSLRFWLFYGLALCIMAVYAVIWQQLLKFLPITTAYAAKGMTALWSALWGVCFFGETISPKQLLSAAVIAAGVGLVISNES